jgi:Rieske Fe-S protein
MGASRCKQCLNRRQVLGGSVQVIATAVALPPLAMLSGCGPVGGTSQSIPNNPANTYTFNFANYPALENPGGSIVELVAATSGEVPVAVVRVSASEISVVEAVCTHAGCEINPYDASSQAFLCPCHGSMFGANGSVLRGPAYYPLRSYIAELNSSGVVATIP